MPKPLATRGSPAKQSSALLVLVLLLGLSRHAARCEPLQGRLEHVHKLPAVSHLLKPGIHYDEAANKIPASNAWVRVPAWLAGTWLVTEETAVFRENFSTGQRSNEHHTFSARNKFAYGKQKDKTGQVWHYVGVPYTSDTQISGKIEYHQVREKEVIEQSDHKVAVRSKVLVIRVSKPSGEIDQTYQQESITWYTDNADGIISMESSTKAFNADGRPLSVTQNRARIHRVAKFTVVDEEYGKNLKALFHQYLIAQGWNSLIPD